MSNEEIALITREILKRTDLDAKTTRGLLDDVRKLIPPEANRWNFRYVVVALALVAISVPVFAVSQLATGGDGKIPESLLSVAATAVGALSGFMTQFGNGRRGTSESPPSPGSKP